MSLACHVHGDCWAVTGTRVSAGMALLVRGGLWRAPCPQSQQAASAGLMSNKTPHMASPMTSPTRVLCLPPRMRVTRGQITGSCHRSGFVRLFPSTGCRNAGAGVHTHSVPGETRVAHAR